MKLKKTEQSRKFLNSKRDVHLLIYIWNWKLATTNMIHAKFFKGLKQRTAYTRLYRLKRRGLIKVTRNEAFAAWTLSKPGYELIKSCLGELQESGFKSEAPKHDLVSAIIQQGETLLKPDSSIHFVTEQQMRRNSPHNLEDWVPSPEVHRPDGYWRFNDELTASLEVETSVKNNTYLEEIMSFYGDSPQVDRVLWVITSPAYGKRILKFEKKNPCANGDKHNVVLLKDSLKKLWQAKIVMGPETNMTLRDFLLREPANTPQTSSKPVDCDYLLDTSLMPRNQSKPRNPLELINRV